MCGCVSFTKVVLKSDSVEPVSHHLLPRTARAVMPSSLTSSLLSESYTGEQPWRQLTSRRTRSYTQLKFPPRIRRLLLSHRLLTFSPPSPRSSRSLMISFKGGGAPPPLTCHQQSRLDLEASATRSLRAALTLPFVCCGGFSSIGTL